MIGISIVQKRLGEKTLGIRRHFWENYTKIDDREIMFYGVHEYKFFEWSKSADFFTTVMKLSIP